MLNSIIGFSVRNKLIIGILVVFLVAFGGYQATRLPVDAVPDITNNQVQVITVAPSFGAMDIERLVTFPIEQATANINGLIELRSFSRFGLSVVTIVFDDNTDVYWARQQVSERLQKIQDQIPPGIGMPELGPITTGLGEIYQYVVRPKAGYEHRYDALELRTIQDWIVRRQLLGVPGVAEVSSFGGKVKQYEISIDQHRLQAHNLTIEDVFIALEQNNENTGGAYIERGPNVLFIRTEGLIGKFGDIENIYVTTTPGGTPVLIRDIASVSIGHATRYGALTYNDQGEVAGAIVMMLKGANSKEVIQNVKERIEMIRQTLPEGVVIEPFLDRTKMVDNAIRTVETNLLEGALIVIFILVLFLGNLRAGLLVASVIPLSMLFAIIMMNLFGVSGNLMSLGALDFGLIVDGAVIIVEAVMHRLTHSKKFSHLKSLTGNEMDDEVTQSAGRMMNSAVFGQIIILIVYLPIFTLEGIEGKMFKPMAQTVSFALIGAFLLSLTYIPMMSSLVLSRKIRHEPSFSDRAMFAVERFYQHWLEFTLRFSKSVLISTLILFLSSLYILIRLGGEFIPALEEGDFAVETRLLPGSNLNLAVESTTKAAHVLLRDFPEVEKVVSKIGSGEIPTDPMPIEAADMMIILKPKETWTSAASFDELAIKMGRALEEVPGVAFGFQYPVQMRFNELMTGSKQDVICKIFGENLDTLAIYAGRLGRIVRGVSGSEDLYVEPVTGLDQIVISYNRQAIAQYHLSISEVNHVVNMAFAGQSAGKVFEEERRFDLVVRMSNKQRKSLSDVRNLLVPTASGLQVPLYQLADVAIKNGPNQIQREDAKRRIVVGFNARGRDVQSLVKELQEKVALELQLPPGYYVTYGGSFENLNAAKQRLMIAVPLSLILIFLLLYFAFGSVRHGLLIYTAIPLSAIGGIYFLAIRGMPFSISAGVGFIALFGVAVLNGIVLIAEFNRLRKEGTTDVYRVVLMGTKVRLRPVLMTALVASLGFLPMALSSGAGAEVQRPLATVVIGGLLVATFLTLFVLPVLYILFEKSGRRSTGTTALPVIVVLLLTTVPSYGQTKVTLDQALELASKNNLEIKNENIRAEYQRQMIKTSTDIPKTQLSADYGEMNSSYTDNGFGVSQSFSFPTVYSSQKQVYSREWEKSQTAVSLKETDVIRQVSELFFSFLVLKERERILQEADRRYSEALIKAGDRLEKGESNAFEFVLIENQRSLISLQLMDLQEEIDRVLLQFQLSINTEDVQPADGNLIAKAPVIRSDAYAGHPALMMLSSQIQVAEARVRLEKARQLPSFSLGYANMTMRGTGADEVVYGPSSRFQTAQVGVSIPLFFGSQSSRIRAAKTYLELEENTYQLYEKELDIRYRSALNHYQNCRKRVDLLANSTLPNALKIVEMSESLLNNGEINYLDWISLLNQSFQIQSQYLDAVTELNSSTLDMNYLLSK